DWTFGSERTGRQLPECDHREEHRDEGAAERQPRAPSPAWSRRDHRGGRTATLPIFDATPHPRPETGPVGGPRAGPRKHPGALQQSPHSPDILAFTATSRASTQVGCNGLRGAVFEGTIEVGADTAAIQQAAQHDHWTREAPTRILMAAHDTRTARESRRGTRSQ